MSKPKFKGSKKKSVTTRSQETATLYAAIDGRVIPDHELTTFSPSNLVRRFDIDEPSNGPSIVFRSILPYAAFMTGYSASDISAGDVGAATDITVSDPTTALYPITDMAVYYEEDVFPVLLNIFAAGTGKRYEISINETIRLIAMTCGAYVHLLMPLMINKLVYHTDWKKIAPFSDNVPTFLYQLAENLDATDVGIAERYLPMMKRMNNLIMFPRMVSEMKRMLTPMMSVDLHGRVQCPCVSDIGAITAASLTTTITGYLTYIDTHLADANNLMSTFLPFPLLEQNAWDLPELPIIDIDRDSGWYNSNVTPYATFGDTGDPVKSKVMLCDEAADLNALFYTRHCQPIWSEIKLSTIFWLEDHLTDDTYKLITPHYYYNAYIIDDAFDQVDYDGSTIGSGSDAFRYIDYVNCRFASTDVDYGVQKPGTFGAELYYNAIRRLVRLETAYMCSLEVLRPVAAVMAGASLREIRYTIKGMVVDNLAKGR